jgi:3-mercaptopyruvate sulfurtransferase SseA
VKRVADDGGRVGWLSRRAEQRPTEREEPQMTRQTKADLQAKLEQTIALLTAAEQERDAARADAERARRERDDARRAAGRCTTVGRVTATGPFNAADLHASVAEVKGNREVYVEVKGVRRRLDNVFTEDGLGRTLVLSDGAGSTFRTR